MAVRGSGRVCVARDAGGAYMAFRDSNSAHMAIGDSHWAYMAVRISTDSCDRAHVRVSAGERGSVVDDVDDGDERSEISMS